MEQVGEIVAVVVVSGSIVEEVVLVVEVVVEVGVAVTVGMIVTVAVELRTPANKGQLIRS